MYYARYECIFTFMVLLLFENVNKPQKYLYFIKFKYGIMNICSKYSFCNHNVIYWILIFARGPSLGMHQSNVLSALHFLMPFKESFSNHSCRLFMYSLFLLIPIS